MMDIGVNQGMYFVLLIVTETQLFQFQFDHVIMLYIIEPC